MDIDKDTQLFNNLFTNYKERFIHFARTYVDDEMLAEDITVESLMYYWENRKSLFSPSKTSAASLLRIRIEAVDNPVFNIHQHCNRSAP
jgi:RNA polymerase sigma-70 factor (ECF subfamily)